jgi:hypothetical protein
MANPKLAKTRVSTIAWGWRELFTSQTRHLSRRQLRAMMRRLDALNERNCSWVDYWSRDLLIKFLSDQLFYTRKKRKRPDRRVED